MIPANNYSPGIELQSPCVHVYSVDHSATQSVFPRTF